MRLRVPAYVRAIPVVLCAALLLPAHAMAAGPFGPLNDLLALGQAGGQTPDSVPVQKPKAPPYAATPRAHCGPGSRVRIIGEAGLLQAAEEEGLLIADDGDSRVDCLLAGLDRAFTYEKLTCATRAILAGAHFVATNADALLPVEGGQVIAGAGSIVAAIQTATAVAPVVVGKPEPGLYEHGLRRLGGLLPAQVAMIGDRLDTDVLGGKRAGLRTILVLSGVTTDAEVKAASSQPDAIAPDLAAVGSLLGWC